MTARRPVGRGHAGMERTALPFGLLFPAVSDMGPKPAFPHARTGRLSTIEAERRDRNMTTTMQHLREPGTLSIRQRLVKGPTQARAIRRFCLDCVGATSGRGAFDCGDRVCPLHPASPFVGKAMPKHLRPPDYDGEPARVAKRRPSKALIHAQCRQCQPGDRTDCEAADCALYPFRPWDGPGKVPKRRLTEKELSQRRLAQSSRSFQARKARGQRTSTAVGAALDA
jgi:hypothetical protein